MKSLSTTQQARQHNQKPLIALKIALKINHKKLQPSTTPLTEHLQNNQKTPLTQYLNHYYYQNHNQQHHKTTIYYINNTGFLVLFAVFIFAIIGLEFYSGSLHMSCWNPKTGENFWEKQME